MSIERFGGLRVRIAGEAARLMYEEGVKQYFTAKRMAARRLLGKVAGKRMRYQPSDLPSNGEIRDALLGLAELAEGEQRRRRLFAMRILALEAMRALGPFEPRLIGSVSTGHVRRGSDIDVQVFSDHEETFERHLHGLGWFFERERVTIHKAGEIREYTHFHVMDSFPIELTLYPVRDLRFRPRSSTDGKPIVRVRTSALELMLGREHAAAWARYLEDGTIDGLEEAIAERDADERGEGKVRGPFDGLLGDGAGEEPAGGLFAEGGAGGSEGGGEEEDEEYEDYEPLPGFEHFTAPVSPGAR